MAILTLMISNNTPFSCPLIANIISLLSQLCSYLWVSVFIHVSNFLQSSCIAEPGVHSPLQGSCTPVSAMQLLYIPRIYNHVCMYVGDTGRVTTGGDKCRICITRWSLREITGGSYEQVSCAEAGISQWVTTCIVL